MKQRAASVAVATVFCGLLAACAGGMPDVNGFVQKANNAVESAIGNATGAQGLGGPYYQAISGGQTIKGIFAGEDQYKALYAGYAWPRVALEVTSFGARETCWEFNAVIWKNAATKHVEHFRLCDVPIVTTNDAGQTGQVDGMSLSSLSTMMMSAQVMPNVKNTSNQRTAGPLPPVSPFVVNIATVDPLSGQRDPLAMKYDDMLARLAYLTGYTGRQDYRFWLWRFDPAGNRG
ncbi:hypothetical protein [Paraburkholderia dilworthii]|uniref:Lipoprotein n=1 Tax=Paraburkholderia dilworthii TaxID=948106 RepID=A0ABW9D7C7_9BURK